MKKKLIFLIICAVFFALHIAYSDSDKPNYQNTEEVPLSFTVSPPIVSRAEEADINVIRSRAIEWVFLRKRNAPAVWQNPDKPRSYSFFDPDSKKYGHPPTEVFPNVLFHKIGWEPYTLRAIMTGESPGIRSNSDIWATPGFPFGNRDGPALAFLREDQTPMKMPKSNQKIPGVPLNKIRFIGIGDDINFRVVWINQDYKAWFDEKIAPRIEMLEADLNALIAEEKLPADYISPKQALEMSLKGKQITFRTGFKASCQRFYRSVLGSKDFR